MTQDIYLKKYPEKIKLISKDAHLTSTNPIIKFDQNIVKS